MRTREVLFVFVAAAGGIFGCSGSDDPAQELPETVSADIFWDEWAQLPLRTREGLDVGALLWGGPGYGLVEMEGEAPVTATGEDWALREGVVTLTVADGAPGSDKADGFSMTTGSLGPALGLPACRVEIVGSTLTVTGPTRDLGGSGYRSEAKTYTFAGLKEALGRDLDAAITAAISAPAPTISPEISAARCGASPNARIQDGLLLSVAHDIDQQIMNRTNGLKTADFAQSSIFTAHLRVENIVETCCARGILRPRVGGDATVIDGTFEMSKNKWEGTWTLCSWTEPAAECDDPCEPGQCLEALCADGSDNDGDGGADCADADCAGASCGEGCECREGAKAETLCADGLDNDGDEAFDCDDPSCAGVSCGEGCVCGQTEVCDDGKDNDGDKAVDCADDGCAAKSCGDACLCQGGQATEQSCTDGADNDGDKMVDCEDGADCDGKSCGDGKVCGGGACESVTGWRPPVELVSSPDGRAAKQKLALDDAGSSLAVWEQYVGGSGNRRVDARYLTSGGAWAATQALSAELDNGFDVDVAFDAGGRAFVLWQDRGTDDLYVSSWTADGGWTAAHELTSDDHLTGGGKLAVDHTTGNAIVAWEGWESGVDGDLLLASWYTPDGGWSAPVASALDGWNLSKVDVAFGADGSAMAVCNRTGVDYLEVVACRYTPGTGWGTAVALDQDVLSVSPHVVALQPAGYLAVWRGGASDADPHEVLASVSTASGGSWSAPTRLDTGAASVHFIDAAADAAGNVFVVWLGAAAWQQNPVTVSANRYSAASGTWSGPEELLTGYTQWGGGGDNPALAVSRGGDALVLWSALTAPMPDDPDFEVYARHLEGGGGAWSEPVTLGPGARAAAALAPNGDATALWLSDNGSGEDGVWSRRYVAP